MRKRLVQLALTALLGACSAPGCVTVKIKVSQEIPVKESEWLRLLRLVESGSMEGSVLMRGKKIALRQSGQTHYIRFRKSTRVHFKIEVGAPSLRREQGKLLLNPAIRSFSLTFSRPVELSYRGRIHVQVRSVSAKIPRDPEVAARELGKLSVKVRLRVRLGTFLAVLLAGPVCSVGEYVPASRLTGKGLFQSIQVRAFRLKLKENVSALLWGQRLALGAGGHLELRDLQIDTSARSARGALLARLPIRQGSSLVTRSGSLRTGRGVIALEGHFGKRAGVWKVRLGGGDGPGLRVVLERSKVTYSVTDAAFDLDLERGSVTIASCALEVRGRTLTALGPGCRPKVAFRLRGTAKIAGLGRIELSTPPRHLERLLLVAQREIQRLGAPGVGVSMSEGFLRRVFRRHLWSRLKARVLKLKPPGFESMKVTAPSISLGQQQVHFAGHISLATPALPFSVEADFRGGLALAVEGDSLLLAPRVVFVGVSLAAAEKIRRQDALLLPVLDSLVAGILDGLTAQPPDPLRVSLRLERSALLTRKGIRVKGPVPMVVSALEDTRFFLGLGRSSLLVDGKGLHLLAEVRLSRGSPARAHSASAARPAGGGGRSPREMFKAFSTAFWKRWKRHLDLPSSGARAEVAVSKAAMARAINRALARPLFCISAKVDRPRLVEVKDKTVWVRKPRCDPAAWSKLHPRPVRDCVAQCTRPDCGRCWRHPICCTRRKAACLACKARHRARLSSWRLRRAGWRVKCKDAVRSVATRLANVGSVSAWLSLRSDASACIHRVRVRSDLTDVSVLATAELTARVGYGVTFQPRRVGRLVCTSRFEHTGELNAAVQLDRKVLGVSGLSFSRGAFSFVTSPVPLNVRIDPSPVRQIVESRRFRASCRVLRVAGKLAYMFNIKDFRTRYKEITRGQFTFVVPPTVLSVPFGGFTVKVDGEPFALSPHWGRRSISLRN